MTRPRPHSWARARTKPQVLLILTLIPDKEELSLMESWLGLFMKIRKRQAEGAVPCAVQTAARSFREEGAILEGSCKEELQERSKVEAEFEKEEQVRKRVPLNRRFWAAQVVEAQAVV